MTPERQKAFAEALMATVKDIPVNHGIEPQVTEALVRELPGLEPFKDDLGTLLSWAFDVHALRVLEHKEQMDVRVRQWENDLAARRNGEPRPT